MTAHGVAATTTTTCARTRRVRQRRHLRPTRRTSRPAPAHDAGPCGSSRGCCCRCCEEGAPAPSVANDGSSCVALLQVRPRGADCCSCRTCTCTRAAAASTRAPRTSTPDPARVGGAFNEQRWATDCLALFVHARRARGRPQVRPSGRQETDRHSSCGSSVQARRAYGWGVLPLVRVCVVSPWSGGVHVMIIFSH